MRPPNEKGGPGTTRNPPPRHDEGRPLAGMAPHEVEQTTYTESVRHAVERVTPMRRYPVAYVSLYAPAGRRTRWWAAYVCAHCGAGHFARLSNEADAAGVRRSGCGKRIWIVVARTYRGHVEAVSA